MPRISLIIPVLDGGRRFGRCLKAVSRSTRLPDEVIVVADGCRDDSAAQARRFGATVIETAEPRGPAAARNLGVAQATGEILLFVDADVAVHPDAIAHFESFLGKHPEISAVIGNYDDRPDRRGALSQYKNLLQHFVHLRAPEEAFTFWGALGAIRRDAFEQVGGFDESYRLPSIEDIELGYRLCEGGHRLAHRREILATHLKRWTVRSLFVSDVFRRAVPWTILNRRHGGIPNGLNLDWNERLKVVLIWAAVGLLPFAFLWPWLSVVTLVLLMLALLMNLQLLAFLWKRGGWRVALVGGCWQLFYHWYCGLGFLLGHLGRVPR